MQYDGRIVEAVRDPANMKWRIVRFRDDKSHANHKDVVSEIENCMQDPLHLEFVSARTFRRYLCAARLTV